MNSLPTVLAFDLGTSGVKISLADKEGNILGDAFSAYPTLAHRDGRREQRPTDWWEAFVSATHTLLDGIAFPVDIRAIAGSGHSMGRVPIDRSGRLLEEKTPIWSDTRAVREAAEFFGKIDHRAWYTATGNGSPAHLYAAMKIMHLKAHSPEVYESTAVFLGTKDYLNYRLTGKAATDFSYASGSGLYDLLRNSYREDYVKAAGISPDKLPEIKNPTDIVGYVTPESASLLGIPAGIPVAAGGVDNGCMALGAGCLDEGDTYCSLGSSSWVAYASHQPNTDYETRPYVFAHCIKGMYLPHEGIFSSGTSHAWVLDTLFPDLPRDSRYAEFEALARRSPPGANRLIFCPALAGGSAADPSPDIRGGFFGLDLSHTRADVARATAEGLALHLSYTADKLFRTHTRPKTLILTGGGAKSPLFRQIYADVFGIPTTASPVTQGTASLGAAALALSASGLSDGFSAIRRAIGKSETILPSPESAALYAAQRQDFARVLAAASALSFTPPDIERI